MENQHDITRRLDELEENLPSIPANVVRAGRSTAHRGADVAQTVGQRVSDVVHDISDTARNAASTTSGQGRSGAERTVETARRGVRETSGQARAQASRLTTTARREVDDAVADAASAIDPDDADGLTKAELYERARALDIDGRSEMNKSQLRAAVVGRT